MAVATAQCSVRNLQRNYIVHRLQKGLLSRFGSLSEVKNRLKKILDIYRSDDNVRTGYLASNIISLLRKLDNSRSASTLEDYDFSGYTIRLSSLRNFILRNTNFSHTHFIDSLFLDNFSHILCVNISPNTEFLATSDIEGQLYLWKLDRESNIKPTLMVTVHFPL